MIAGLLAAAGVVSPIYPEPPAVPLVAQESSLWCWAASAEMVLRALGSTEDVSQREQVERLHDLDGRCLRTFCDDGFTSAACQRTGLPRFGDWGFDAEVTGPRERLGWPELAGELRCGPVVFAWGEEAAGDETAGSARGHMVVLTSAREVTVGAPGAGALRLGPWIAVNDPAGAAGACRASYEVWSYEHYRRMTPRIHYYGFRRSGEPYRICPPGESQPAPGSGTFEGKTPDGLVARLLAAVAASAATGDEGGRDSDLAWLTNALALPPSAPWSCDPMGPDQGERRSFRCAAGEVGFFLDIVRSPLGMWRLAAFEREVENP